MSYQCIAYRYASTDSAVAPAGQVFASEGLDAALVEKLKGFVHLEEPPAVGILGPHYIYRIFESQGRTYHTLSCIRTIKDEATQAKGCLAHHLLLTKADVRLVSEDDLNPTPAGLILALENRGFWYTEAPADDSCLGNAPDITGEDLPDPEPRETWELITRDKTCAKVPHTPRFDERCIMMLPSPTDVREVLMLMHESDSLHDSLGWGYTFTTYGTKEDRPENTRRIIVPMGSLVVLEEALGELPMLCINERLTPGLPLEDVDAADMAPIPLKRQRVHPKAPAPYRYVEVPDEQMFRMPLRRFACVLRRLPWLAAAVFLAVVVYLTCLPSAEETPAQAAAPAEQEEKPAQRYVLHPGDQFHAAKYERAFRKGVGVTVQPLVAESRAIRGTVKSAGWLEPEERLVLEDKEGMTHEVVLTWNEGVLEDVRYQGKPAAVRLNAPECELTLVPVLYVELPPFAPASIPRIAFDFKPEDMELQQGRLTCKRMPDLKEPGRARWTEPPTIALPAFAGSKHSIRCKSQQDVPYEMQTELVQESCSLRIYRIDLLLYNPLRRFGEVTFKTVVSTPLNPQLPGSTIERVYVLGKHMEDGTITPEEITEYRTIQSSPLRDVTLPPYSADKDMPRRLQETLCNLINRKMHKYFEQNRMQAEAYRTPLVLELQDIKWTQNGTVLQWVFRLTPRTASPTQTP